MKETYHKTNTKVEKVKTKVKSKVKTKVKKVKTIEKKLKTIWTNPKDPDGFGGVEKLTKRVNNSKKETQKWLSNQLAYSLNKPMLKRFPTRPYKTIGNNDVWQMDLMEMIPYSKINKGYKYILTCIDVFNRYARAVPTKTKSANEMADAIKEMFADGKPINLQTDLGN